MRWLGHNWRVIRQAIAADRERHRARQASNEVDFLPAALEVIEKPVSPTGRATAWVLVIGLVGTLAWMVLGRVDIVASAPGKIVPAGSVKIVQSTSLGVVREIRVRDGDRVKKGELLIALDTTLATAELQQASKALLALELDVARNRAIADALSGESFRFAAPPGTPAAIAESHLALVKAQIGEVEAAIAGFEAARRSALSEAAAAEATRARLDETIPILDHELAAMQVLDAKGYAPGLRLSEMKRQRRSEVGERDVAVAQYARGQSDARRMTEQIVQARQQARRAALAELTKAESEAVVRREDVVKASRRAGLQRLVAPVDGTVQQSAVHTIGGVVEAARTLMVIVPSAQEIEVEVRVLNKDAGFVREGQNANVKIEAFPFTRYGTVPGKVVSVSRDAVADPKIGSIYVARVRLNNDYIVADRRAIPLASGLVATADIRTGSRRIIVWLMSPVMTTLSQAGHEK